MMYVCVTKAAEARLQKQVRSDIIHDNITETHVSNYTPVRTFTEIPELMVELLSSE